MRAGGWIGLGLGALALGAGALAIGGAGALPSGPPVPGGPPGDWSYGPDDLEAAARLIAAENPRAGERVWIEQIWTQIRSRKRGQTLYQRITGGAGYGPQGGKRPVSTDQEASAIHRAVAERVLSGAAPSQLPGARKFFDPAQQDAVYAQVQRGKAALAAGQPISARTQQLIALGYKRDAAAVRAGWAVDGSRLVGAVGPVEFWT